MYDTSIREQLGSYNIDDSNPRFYNFVCPQCGRPDQPNKKKAYIYTDTWLYVCYKCTPKIPYAKWLKERDETAYHQLMFQAFGPNEGKQPKEVRNAPTARIEVPTTLPFKEGEIIPITANHPLADAALAYCRERMIREEVYSDWFVCLQGDQFLDRDANGNYILDANGRPTGNKYKNRLIIPFYRFGGGWSQFDARAIDKRNPLRYLNFAGVHREAYNIGFVNFDEPLYILEGTVDSLFVHNAIAIGGIEHFDSLVMKNPDIMQHKDRVVVIWDNDDKAREAREKTCKLGFKWFTWEGIHSKDVNAAVTAGEFPLDEDGFVRRDVIEARVREPEGSAVLFALKYGNMSKTAAAKRFEGIKKYKENHANSRKAEVLF